MIKKHEIVAINKDTNDVTGIIIKPIILYPELSLLNMNMRPISKRTEKL